MDNQLPLEVKPSGQIFDSTTGDLLDGAQLFLYRDKDNNDDPFDLSSASTRELVPEDEFASPTQQGQE